MAKRAERRHHAKRIIRRRIKDMRIVGSPEFNEHNPTHKYAKTHPLSCNCSLCSPEPAKPRQKHIKESDHE